LESPCVFICNYLPFINLRKRMLNYFNNRPPEILITYEGFSRIKKLKIVIYLEYWEDPYATKEDFNIDL
jgi:hypothetical protein